ncbi:hypothetical protein N9733_09145 [Akkermansiaceae bacterium]|nr:hypothetical protein [Akkermansiaceae bacterium]MDB4310373.1 hypothetical protein [Akkermansiaceae bacterium]
MKLSLCLLILPFFALAQSFPDIPTILQKTDASDPENESHRLFWRTDPGVSYLLTGSTDLLIRSTEEGYPAVAGGPLDFFDFTPSSDPAQKFYRVFRIDEQGPEMLFRYPDDWDYAVPRNSDIFITLSDATAINLSTVSLTVGNGPLITVGENTGLTFSDGVLRYDPGDSVYGDFGEEIPVSFSVTDVVGNLASFDWYFRLESESQVLVPKLVVFGSQKAQEGGQVLSAEQAVISDLLLGELILQGGEESSYELTAITADQLTLTYSGSEVPDFSAGDYVANLCPTRPEEIFYRQITALDVNSSAQVVTLGTTDVDLALLEEGSVDLNNESQIFEVNSEGLLTAIPSLTEVGFYPSRVLNVERPLDFSNTAILDSSSSTVANISARESGFAFGGALEVSLETRGGLLRSVDLRMNGLIGASGLFKIQSLAGGVADQQEVFSASAPTQNYRVVYVGQLGDVPVFTNFGAEATIRASVTSSAASEVEFGFVRIFQQSMELTYDRGTEPNFAMTTKPVNSEQVPYEFPSDGDLQAKVISEPRINFSIYGVGGMSATVVSKMEIGYEAGSDVPAVASFDAGVDITLSTTTSLPEVSKNWPLWQQEWDLLTDLDQLKTAVSQSGDLLTIEHNSLGKFDDDGEWQPNVKDASFTYGGNLIPGENGRTMDTVPYAYAEFFAATGVTIGESSEQSEVVSENIELPLAVVPEEFQPIPAGSFVMGASLAGGGEMNIRRDGFS